MTDGQEAVGEGIGRHRATQRIHVVASPYREDSVRNGLQLVGVPRHGGAVMANNLRAQLIQQEFLELGERMTFEVPTERGERCIVIFEWDAPTDTYTTKFTGPLLDAAPEGLTAALQMACRTLHDWRNQ